MLHSELAQLVTLSAQRNEKLYAWLRWLVLLAAGVFSVMVGQLAGVHFSATRLFLLKLALGLTAAGILSGSAALYGEVSSLRRLVKDRAAHISSVLEGTEVDIEAPVAVEPAWLLRQAEKVCYASLVCSLVSWVAFVLMMDAA